MGKPQVLTRGFVGLDLVNHPNVLPYYSKPYDEETQSLDEYPFASTLEGGLGASEAPIFVPPGMFPTPEQRVGPEFN